MVSGDPASFLTSLSKGLKGYNCPGDWVDTLKERDIEKEKANRYIHVNMLIVIINRECGHYREISDRGLDVLTER